MIMEAVINLNEKEGSSLNAIRKYILHHYDIKNQHKASFNSLTLKAVNKAVASNELEKIKHSFRLTAAEKEKRKIKDIIGDEVSALLITVLYSFFFTSILTYL
jgi:hypothetical protein